MLSFPQPKEKEKKKFATGTNLKSVCLNPMTVDFTYRERKAPVHAVDVKTSGNLLIV